MRPRCFIEKVLAELPGVEAIGDRERASQIAGRSAAGCLVFLGGVPCCSMHDEPLDDRGVCDVCERNADEHAAEVHLAHLERMADCIAETTDDSTLEENLPYYMGERLGEDV